MASRQIKLLIVVVNYFTKWVEPESVARITVEIVRQLYLGNIIFRFGLPRVIVSCNGAQFTITSIVKTCKGTGIQNWFISVKHTSENGQAEVANKIILSGMKKKLEEAKGLWDEYVHEILWSYHTTQHSTTRETPFRMV